MNRSDKLKPLTKDYFNRHPVKDFSAARFEYSLLLNPEIEDIAGELIPELQTKGLRFPDNSGEIAAVKNAEDTSALLRMLRRGLSPMARKVLLDLLLEREEEALPEIQRMLPKAFNDHTIENCIRFMVKCQANCTEWILQNYSHVREPYARSMLCLVLGFRADADVIPFLLQQVDTFERQFPSNTFEQAPLIALMEIRNRFQAN